MDKNFKLLKYANDTLVIRKPMKGEWYYNHTTQTIEEYKEHYPYDTSIYYVEYIPNGWQPEVYSSYWYYNFEHEKEFSDTRRRVDDNYKIRLKFGNVFPNQEDAKNPANVTQILKNMIKEIENDPAYMKINQKYWFINLVSGKSQQINYLNTIVDRQNIQFNNCFKTRAEAETPDNIVKVLTNVLNHLKTKLKQHEH